MLGLVENTERGFERLEFTDRYGVKCSLQQSSLATEDAIWLGCNEANPQVFVPNGNPSWRPVPMPDEYIADTRMHLTREQVEGLMFHLQSWLDTGSF